MKKNSPIISIVVPPFPTFIEGNLTSYTIGQEHPNRRNLSYFDIILVLEGELYITEEDSEWIIRKDEGLILLPKKHHYSTKACSCHTKFYWLHFYTDGKWVQGESPVILKSTIDIPNLHYHNEDYTMHLNKWQKLNDPEHIYSIIEALLKGTIEPQSISFWKNQQRFLSLLKILEEQGSLKLAYMSLAEKIEIYLKNNFTQNITNQTLSEHFHFHKNYLIRCMKKTYGCTPLEYLSNYRLENAVNLLMKTNLPISAISEQCGYENVPYFSLSFKKKFACSPLNYRKQHIGS